MPYKKVCGYHRIRYLHVLLHDINYIIKMFHNLIRVLMCLKKGITNKWLMGTNPNPAAVVEFIFSNIPKSSQNISKAFHKGSWGMLTSGVFWSQIPG